MRRICLTCGDDISDRHLNAKRCKKCAILKKENPHHNLTTIQQKKALKLAGKITRKEIAIEIGSSRSAVNRFFKSKMIKSNALKYKDDVIDSVCRFYELNGRVATQKKFKNIKIRSIIERYYADTGLKPRSNKWTAEECIKVMKMAGLTSKKNQAKIMNRPAANEGSIKSFYSKKIIGNARYINGISYNLAKHYVNDGCPCYLVSGEEGSTSSMWMILWVDVYDCLNNNTPKHIKNAIKALAEFQKKLHGLNYRDKIEGYIAYG